jgi:hypothetical protein
MLSPAKASAKSISEISMKQKMEEKKCRKDIWLRHFRKIKWMRYFFWILPDN